MEKLSECPDLLDKVIALDPDSVYIENAISVFFETNLQNIDKTQIEPFVIIRGLSIIKNHCTLKTGSEIINSVIGRNTIIHKAIIEDSEVGDDCEFGPGAQVKRCQIGSKVIMKHQCYLGDAIVGNGCNIGHQVSAANFDGAEKHKTYIGEKVFIGDSVKLVAPINIGDEAYIADGTIRKNIPDHALVIGTRFNEKTGKFEEIIKENRSFKINGKWILKK